MQRSRLQVLPPCFPCSSVGSCATCCLRNRLQRADVSKDVEKRSLDAPLLANVRDSRWSAFAHSLARLLPFCSRPLASQRHRSEQQQQQQQQQQKQKRQQQQSLLLSSPRTNPRGAAASRREHCSCRFVCPPALPFHLFLSTKNQYEILRSPSAWQPSPLPPDLRSASAPCLRTRHAARNSVVSSHCIPRAVSGYE